MKINRSNDWINVILEMKESRHNLIGFLHISDIKRIEYLSNDYINVDKMNFYNAVDLVLDFYKRKVIKRESAGKILEILFENNNYFRTETYYA